jgi:hypothetical protein
MLKTSDLINNLSSEVKPLQPLKKPSYWIAQFVLLSLVYYIIAQSFLGFRVDLSEKFSQISFIIEISLILLLLLFCLVSAILTIYPDSYQKPYLLKIPYLILLIITGFLIAEFCAQPFDELPDINISHHTFECSLCIATIAIIPAFYFFYILHKGANLHYLQAGIFAVVAASTIGYLVLRMSEKNDFLPHLLIWHYLPILMLSVIGAYAGKKALRW